MDRAEALKKEDRVVYNLPNHELKEAAYMAFDALREQKPKWISVEERLPENNATVFVYRPKMVIKYMTSYYCNGFCEGNLDIRGNEVITHWMPLPEPPEVEV